MKQELDKTYSPQENEDKIYKIWEDSGFFNPDNLNLSIDAPSYTIVLPPPNITAKLHIGHSCMLAIEDLLIRYCRMTGYRALWIPGTDHAAIATQMAVEKKIFKESGQTRHDLGREKLLEEIWKFLRETQATILHQTKKMGSSLDWSREAFTLDETRQKAVTRLFVDMYREGVIYRGERIVNWCPHCHSTLADDEVEYKEQQAKIYTFKYSADFPIAISTTRPETKLGDTAVAVNPKDERYKEYIGKEYDVDFCGQKLHLKVIADYNVEMNFGTGALGVTPAHSMVDWQMALTNDLAVIKVIDEDGKIHDGFGKYSGLIVEEARKLVTQELNSRGLMEKEEDLTNNLSICYRCDTPVEPLPSKQWFVGVDVKLDRLGGKSLKEKALEVAQNNSIEFIPERFGKRYQNWMENLHDWCISRQIWFGHAIPVWYRGEEIYCGEIAPEGSGWLKDENTLDTWFSSGMWTFSTLGWPDNYQNGVKTGDLAKFHPTQILETGYEILTLWVSRMVMMSIFTLGEIPFEKVYLHGTILDAKGKKMSKSRGNGVDPLEAISEYGADALRLSLLMGATPGNDSRYSAEKIEAKRNFINKLWNISRYILSNLNPETDLKNDSIPETKTLADRWILSELVSTRISVQNRLENFEFSLAAEELTDLTWNKIADWYLEIAKIEKNKDAILIYLLKNILIMWHPFIPYVTELIWDQLADGLLLVKQWPKNENFEIDKEAILNINDLQEIIVSIRNARQENKIEPGKKIKALIYSKESFITESIDLIKGLKTGLSDLEIKESGLAPAASIAIATKHSDIYLLDAVDNAKEQLRLLKEKENLEKLVVNLENKLNNEEFISRAPENIVTAEKNKLNNYLLELAKINKLII